MLGNKALSAAPSAVPVYIEDVFSTYLYTGNGSTQTITNNIDLSTKGGLVWQKSRSNALANVLSDTTRGTGVFLESDSTGSESANANSITAFNTTGFSFGSLAKANTNAATYVSWTFAQQAKFFDVVTYTGNGTAGRAINHSLGSTPGCIIVKSTSGSDAWIVWHRSSNSGTGNAYGQLAATNAFATDNGTFWGSGSYTAPTSTTFTVSDHSAVNGSGATYVAYLFAHDAGGFGASGSDSVIKCGSVVGSSNVEVNLGWEPQWLLVKNTSAAQDWWLVDNMRGLPVQDTSSAYNASNLRPNLSDAETTGFSIAPSATGFKANVLTSSQTYIYIAIRRGPMKTPTSGTSVFSPVARTGTGATATVTSGFPVSSAWISSRTNTVSQGFQVYDRLRGANARLSPPYTQQEYSTPTNELTGFDSNTSVTLGASTPDRLTNFSGETYINYFFQRAPGFFDVVCYTGTGSAKTETHNLGVKPDLMILKARSTTGAWTVYSSSLGATKYLEFNTSAENTGTNRWNDTEPTSSVFTIGTTGTINTSGQTYVAYLFASVTGVSKVGTYTGNGSNQTINCGFTGGARFVLIKRTDSTGDWVVFDSARGIVAGNDPALELNTTDAEVTTIDAVDTDNSGFVVNQETTFNLNVNNATYIFYAVA